MAAIFPIVLKPVKDDWKELDLKRSDSSALSIFAKVMSDFQMFVNPTEIQIKKDSKIVNIRHLGGNYFTTWNNMPDSITLRGIIYGGVKAINDIAIINSISSNEYRGKAVNLFYKWRPYKCYIESIIMSLDAEKPGVINYTIELTCTESFRLYTLLTGNVQPLQTDISFLRSSYNSISALVSSVVKNGKVNTWGAAYVAANGLMSSSGFKASRLLQYFAGYFLISKIIGKRK